MNWDAVRFVDCILCDDECASFTAGGVTYEPEKSVCGYCLWRFKRGLDRRGRRISKQQRDYLFTEFVVKHLEYIAKTGGKSKFKGGRKTRDEGIKEAAILAGYSRTRYKAGTLSQYRERLDRRRIKA